MENEGTEAAEREGSGKGALEENTIITEVTKEEDKEKEGEQNGNQKMNIEEDWHASELSSTQVGMTDFEPQSKAAKQLEWNTYGGWSSNESLIHDPEFVNDTPVTMTNNERPKRRNTLTTRLENPIHSSLPSLIQHTKTVAVTEWKENQDIS